MEIEILDESHSSLIDEFSCVEDEEKLKKLFNSRERRRIKRHSEEIDCFLKEEALEEQKQGLNTTHIFIEENKIVGFVSICNDSIQLEYNERSKEHIVYENVPAVKVARLGVSNVFQGNRFGYKLLDFSVVLAVLVRKFSGIKFLTVDCYEHRLSFYETFGFVKNTCQPSQKRNYDNPISLRLHIDKYLEKLEDTSFQ